MGQCEGKTKKGERCKRDARDGAFCNIHKEQETRARKEPSGEWDNDAIMKAAIGFALVGVIFLFRFRR